MLLSWLWNIGVALVVSVSGSFVFEVLFVIVNEVVLVGSWL